MTKAIRPILPGQQAPAMQPSTGRRKLAPTPAAPPKLPAPRPDAERGPSLLARPGGRPQVQTMEWIDDGTPPPPPKHVGYTRRG